MIDKLLMQIQTLRHRRRTQKLAARPRHQKRSTPKQDIADAQLRQICQDLEDRLTKYEVRVPQLDLQNPSSSPFELRKAAS